ncbi:hypothetical protein WA588_001603 [Blastocystis sp. NMH]
MDHLPDALSIGFIQKETDIDSSDSIIVDRLQFPRYIPPPQYLKASDCPFKSVYAPEYEQYKSLFPCQSRDSHFYIEFPKAPSVVLKPVAPPAPVKPAPSAKQGVHEVNAFSSAYRDEVNGFLTSLQALLRAMEMQKNSIVSDLRNDTKSLQERIETCAKTPTLAAVNDLREYHAQLQTKYARYL